MTITLTEYGFGHAYDCRELPATPTNADLILIPMESSAEEGRRLVVEIKPENGASWVGAFRRGFDDYLEALLECPDPSSVCVVAGGTAFAVTVGDSAHWRDLRVIPTVGAAGYASVGLLFLASFNVVAAFDASMHEIWKTDLGSDGIEFVGVDDGTLKVRAYMPGFDDWIVRSLAVTDGAASKLEGFTFPK